MLHILSKVSIPNSKDGSSCQYLWTATLLLSAAVSATAIRMLFGFSCPSGQVLLHHKKYCNRPPWSPLSMPSMSNLTPVGWVAIFDVSEQIFESVQNAEYHWKAPVSTHGLKWSPVNLSRPDSIKMQMSGENALADLHTKTYVLKITN